MRSSVLCLAVAVVLGCTTTQRVRLQLLDETARGCSSACAHHARYERTTAEAARAEFDCLRQCAGAEESEAECDPDESASEAVCREKSVASGGGVLVVILAVVVVLVVIAAPSEAPSS